MPLIRSSGRPLLWGFPHGQSHVQPRSGGDGGGGGGDAWLVVGDFKNGVYAVSGLPVDVTDMFQDDDTDGDAFHPEAIVNGVGYVGPEVGDYGASLAGAALAAALPAATIYFELNFTAESINPDTPTPGIAIIVYDGTEFACGFIFDCTPLNGLGLLKNFFDNSVAPETTNLLVFHDGLNKLAISYTADHASYSFNGSNVATLATTGIYANIARITPFFYVGVTIEVMKVRSAMADADLPALTALA